MNAKKILTMSAWLLAPIALLAVSSGCEVSGPLNISAQLSGLLNGQRDATTNDDHGGNGNDDGIGHDANDDNPGGGGNNKNAGGANSEIRLRADLDGPSALSGNADYRNLGSRQRLKIEIEHAGAGTNVQITVAGVDVGTLTANNVGRAQVEFDTRNEPGHAPWPANLTTNLSAGTVIVAGDAMGSLALDM